MDSDQLNTILNAVANGELSSAQAFEQLKALTYEELDFAKLDVHRYERQGMPEFIYCPGKSVNQIVAIAKAFIVHHPLVLATRANKEVAAQVLALMPQARYQEIARIIVFGDFPTARFVESVAVVTAGTADMPAAEEAALFLIASGVPVYRIYDVGVAGIHRLFANLDTLRKSEVVVVVAGMDGALPSVVGGWIKKPIIAVPTSVGHGANFEGLAPLLTMLNSCAPGVTVVNIDSGFSAAAAALRIMQMLSCRLADFPARR